MAVFKMKEMIFNVHTSPNGMNMIYDCKGELVRCGECKWYEKTKDYGDGYYNCLFHAQEDCAPFPENGYCSYGERKDGERDGRTD